MEQLISVLEPTVIICLPIFAITMLVIIITVRKHNKELIESAFKNKWLLNFDLSVISNSRREFERLNKSKTVLYLNSITGVISIFGFVLIFILAIIGEILQL